jgi:hypothetical protein
MPPKRDNDLIKFGQLCTNAFQVLKKHFLFTFKYKTPHRYIERVAAFVEAQAFLPGCGDRRDSRGLPGRSGDASGYIANIGAKA